MDNTNPIKNQDPEENQNQNSSDSDSTEEKSSEEAQTSAETSSEPTSAEASETTDEEASEEAEVEEEAASESEEKAESEEETTSAEASEAADEEASEEEDGESDEVSDTPEDEAEAETEEETEIDLESARLPKKEMDEEEDDLFDREKDSSDPLGLVHPTRPTQKYPSPILDGISHRLTPEQYMEEGRQAIKDGEWEVAKLAFIEVIAHNPENEEASQGLELAEQNLRQEAFDRLVSQGQALMADGKLNGARIKFESALLLKDDPDLQALAQDLRDQLTGAEFRHYFEEGRKLYEVGAYKEASEYLERARSLKDDDKTEEMFFACKDKMTKIAQIIWEAGKYAQEGQWSEGIRHLEKGYDVYPDHQDLLVTSAVYSSHRSQYNSLLRSAQDGERVGNLWRAWNDYGEILIYSPYDSRVRNRRIVILLKFIGIAILVGVVLWWLLFRL